MLEIKKTYDSTSQGIPHREFPSNIPQGIYCLGNIALFIMEINYG